MTKNEFNHSLQNINLFAFDVDGVFTDGRIYISDSGVESKDFHTHDGYGIRQLIETGVEVAIISGRNSAAVEQRMLDLGIDNIKLGCNDKVLAFEEIITKIGIKASECGYAGDDTLDIPLLNIVGLPVTVQNAHPEVKKICKYTTIKTGGHGAVREICDLLINARKKRQEK